MSRAALWAVLLALLLAAPRAVADEAAAITVAVADFQNRQVLLDQDWISGAAADLIGSALANVARDSAITVLDRSGRAALDQEAQLAGGVAARGTAATHVLGGSFTVADGIVQLDVALGRVGGQAPLWTQRLRGPLDGLAGLARQAAAGALASLGAPSGAGAATPSAQELPLAALVTYQRGRAAARRGDHAWALADLLRTCKAAPHFGEAWLALGSTFAALGRPAAALAAWEQAVAADPDDPSMPAALFRLAGACEDRPEQARRLYQRIIDDYPYSRAPADLAGEITNGQRPPTLAVLAQQRLARVASAPAVASASAPASAAGAPAGSARVSYEIAPQAPVAAPAAAPPAASAAPPLPPSTPPLAPVSAVDPAPPTASARPRGIVGGLLIIAATLVLTAACAAWWWWARRRRGAEDRL